MPVPVPLVNESRKKFMNRCIPFLISEGRPANQAGGICTSQFGRKQKIKDELEKPVLSVNFKSKSILS